jgi:hypothetical protein
MVVHISNLSPQKTEARRSGVPGQPGLHSKTLSQKKNREKEGRERRKGERDRDRRKEQKNEMKRRKEIEKERKREREEGRKRKAFLTLVLTIFDCDNKSVGNKASGITSN